MGFRLLKEKRHIATRAPAFAINSLNFCAPREQFSALPISPPARSPPPFPRAVIITPLAVHNFDQCTSSFGGYQAGSSRAQTGHGARTVRAFRFLSIKPAMPLTRAFTCFRYRPSSASFWNVRDGYSIGIDISSSRIQRRRLHRESAVSGD